MQKTTVKQTEIYKKLNRKNREKYKKILEVAVDVFLEQGYINASMHEVVKRSGGSLTTLYKIFSNKETLFMEILHEHSNVLKETFQQLENQNENNMEAFLYNIGRKFADTMFQDRTVSFYRLLVTDGYKNDSEIGKFCISTWSTLTEIIDNRFIAEGIDSQKASSVSYQFLEASIRPFFSYLVFGIKDAIPDDKIDDNIKLAAKIFANAIKII